MAAKTAQKAKTPPKTEELFSISKLAQRFDLDRATIRKRLDNAHVQPVKSSAREKLYRLADVESVLSSTSDSLDAVKLRKLEAEADLKELELQQERGELVLFKEVKDELQKVFSRLHQRLAVQYPREIAGQLYEADTRAQVADILRNGITKIFNDLRADYTTFFGSDSGRNSRG